MQTGSVLTGRASDLKEAIDMDKWTELRETIRELHEANDDKPDVENVTRFLLNLMDVLDGKCEGGNNITKTQMYNNKNIREQMTK